MNINSEIKITFNEKEHRYFDQFKREYTSVTTFIGKQFPFDADEVIAKIQTYPQSKYYKMPAEEIKALWENTAVQGNRVHNACEDFLKEGKFPKDSDLQPLVHQFSKLKFKGEVLSEYIVFDERYLLAGMADIIEVCDDVIYVSDIKTSNKIEDDKLFQYSIQLELYRRFCQRLFNKKAVSLGIFHFENFVKYGANTRMNFIRPFDVGDMCDSMLKSVNI